VVGVILPDTFSLKAQTGQLIVRILIMKSFDFIFKPHNLMSCVVYRAVTWLTVTFQLELTKSLREFRQLVESLDRISKTQSPKGLVLYCKEVRLYLCRYLSGKPLLRSNVIKVTKDGIPVILGPWIPNLRSGNISADDLRMLMTIFSSTRALSLGDKPDFTPITNASQ